MTEWLASGAPRSQSRLSYCESIKRDLFCWILEIKPLCKRRKNCFEPSIIDSTLEIHTLFGVVLVANHLGVDAG